MSTAALIAFASQIGAPLIEGILAGKIGAGNATLVRDTVEAIATRVGVSAPQLEQMPVDEVSQFEDAIREVEVDIAPELIALYSQEIEGKMALFAQEAKEGWFSWGWRPAGMWVVLASFLFNAFGLHLVNAYFKIALPPMDWGQFMTFAGFYMSLYMGGHTLKNVAATWRGGPNA